MVNILKPGCFKFVIVNIMNNCSSHVTKIDHLASRQNRPCLCLRVYQSKICILLKHACWWMKAIIFRVLITLQIHVGIQCSSDISELSIPVLYAYILCIRACQYTHTRMYVSSLCIPIRFFIWSMVGQTGHFWNFWNENSFSENRQWKLKYF